jgi:hypothetical protein
MLTAPYLAGIIDGEGSIDLRVRNPHVGAANTSRGPMTDASNRLNSEEGSTSRPAPAATT